MATKSTQCSDYEVLIRAIKSSEPDDQWLNQIADHGPLNVRNYDLTGDQADEIRELAQRRRGS